MEVLLPLLVERLQVVLWPATRIGALMMTAPLFSLGAFNRRLRMAFTLALSVYMLPLVQWPVLDPTSSAGLLALLQEAALGALMGLTLQIALAAVVVAGQALSSSMGLSMASLIDPQLGNVPVISQLLVMLASLVFLGTGGHGVLIATLLESFRSLPPGSGVLTPAAIDRVLVWSGLMFTGAVLAALPVLVMLLLVNIGLGVVTRAAPSLNLFSMGFPALVGVGLIVLWLSLDGVLRRVDWIWLQGLQQVRRLVEG